MSAPGVHLQVDGLARRFGRRWAVAHVDLDVRPGQALLLTGPNGSGKTTLLRCLSTAIKAHQGQIRLDGQPLWESRGTLRAQIGYLAHLHRIYEDLSGRENLEAWARLGGYDRSRVPDLLRRVELDPTRRDPAKTYSAGMRRRLALAITLLKQPRLMLLDEPFASLDPPGRLLLGGVIQELRQTGCTVVMASHLPREAQPYTTEAIHLEAGQITWRGTPAEAAAMGGYRP